MKNMKLNHDAPDIPTAFGLTKKRATAIDAFTRLSFKAESDHKVSEVFSGAIKTGVVKNQNEIAFMGICVGILLQMRIEHLIELKKKEEAQKQSIADKHIEHLVAEAPKILTAKK